MCLQTHILHFSCCPILGQKKIAITNAITVILNVVNHLVLINLSVQSNTTYRFIFVYLNTTGCPLPKKNHLAIAVAPSIINRIASLSTNIPYINKWKN
jgi:hypothetical protein